MVTLCARPAPCLTDSLAFVRVIISVRDSTRRKTMYSVSTLNSFDWVDTLSIRLCDRSRTEIVLTSVFGRRTDALRPRATVFEVSAVKLMSDDARKQDGEVR
jgi:hypothetical protein